VRLPPAGPAAMTLESLDLAGIQLAARHAWRISTAYPWRLIGCTVLILLAVDLPTQVPGIGFLIKIGLASLLFAQMLLLFRDADRGQSPNMMTLLHTLSMPMTSQLALVLSEWATFGIAVVFLWQAGGADAALTFFAEPHADATLDASLYFEFKVVLFVASAPLTFLAPAIVLAGVHGATVLRVALLAAVRNPLFVVLLLCLDIALEFVLSRLDEAGGIGLWIHLPLLVLSLVYELALLYAVSVRVFGLTPGKPDDGGGDRGSDRPRP